MNLHQMGAEKMPEKMPETFDSMRISSIFHNPSFTDSGFNLASVTLGSEKSTNNSEQQL
jgi:hypothetical protein